MTGATMFSGIQAPEVAAPEIDWRWCAEIEPFPCAVITQRHPQIQNLGDVTNHDFIERATARGSIELMVFGSPCQSFSVAGRRLGLDDPRGNLALIALGIVNALRPRWFLFENVPGLLSSWSGDEDDGEIVTEDSDFAGFIQTVQDIGYCGAWASPDAQWFGLAQRRERVFFVGHSGTWQGPAAVLAEFQGLSGYTPACVEARQRSAARADAGSRNRSFWQSIAKAFGCGRAEIEVLEREESGVAPALTSSGRGVERTGESRGNDPLVVVPDVAMRLNAKGGMGRIDGESETFIAHALRADGFDASEDGTGRGTPLVPVSFRASGQEGFTPQVFSPPITSTDGGGAGVPTVAIPFDTTQITSKLNRSHPKPGDPCHPLACGAHAPAVAFTSGIAVRRLTPRECERLQGFPDDYTLVTYRGKLAADGPRYKALGNSMAVPKVRYLIQRIQQVDCLLAAQGFESEEKAS